ncbi:hypothetical protein WJ969_26450 [Achromobacter xylosoxidans]
MADQIQALQQEVAQLRDQLELVSRQQPSANKPGGAAGGANPPGATAGDPQEQAAYDGAIDLFRKGQYKEASESLAAFTALYPASQLAPSPVLPGQQPLRAEGLQGRHRTTERHGAEGARQRPRP